LARLAFISLAQTVSAGGCSGLLTVQSQDAFGIPSNVAAATPVGLASSSATTAFESSSSCTAVITGVAIGAGANTASFYFTDTAAGNPTLTASATGFTSATQLETVNPAPAKQLVFFTAAQTVTAGVCSLIATVQSQDNF